MINTVYRLAEPRRFEIAFEDIDPFGENVIVRPTCLSICYALLCRHEGPEGAGGKTADGADSRGCGRGCF